MAYGGFDLGGGLGAEFLSPAMGRIMVESPESLIPFFAEAGISPMAFQQLAQTSTGTATDAAPNTLMPPSPQTFIPWSGDVSRPEDDPYRQPPVTPGMKLGQVDPKLSASDIFGRAKDFYTNAMTPDPNSPFNVQRWFGTGRSAAPPPLAPTKKAEDRVPESRPGPVPPEALDNRVADEPYTPSTRYATLDTGEAAATPRSDPRKQEADTEEASAAKKKREGSLSDAISGVRAPPAPPTPRLHPEVGRAGAFPTGSPIASLLASILSGQATGPDVLRLLQAVPGGK